MTLNDELLAGLGDQGVEQIAGMLGTDTLTARKVIEAVSGTIVGGMARNATHPDGADALRGALDDHMDADPFNGDVASLTRDGHSILGHVLGGQGTEQAAVRLSQLAGVNSATLMKLLPLIAPMIMSLLANRAASHDMDADAVADDLSREESAIPAGLGELLGSLLGSIFGGAAVPKQAGPYDPYHDPLRSEREVAPGRSNPDW
ncbi:DUF937 domain-containing protein [Nonomuraea gerenzanensis]|uniref:DUF937 domain-containing protein n=1 Tax=Nonomuraea gerenzanensis TaxID=93944 RepID=UPI001CDA07F1|nr:DUF937 domain-containing protein [Nonomuraea gerenzanensis]UBU11051.1 DUF937 domain-containing protein [Nonomuraea gerenzanensis]